MSYDNESEGSWVEEILTELRKKNLPYLNNMFEWVPVIKRDSWVLDLLEDLPEGCNIAGGFARWLCTPNENSVEGDDLDLFCLNQEVFDKTINKFKNEKVGGIKWKPHAVNENFVNFESEDFIVQIVRPEIVSGTFEEIISTFDFTVNRVIIRDREYALVDHMFLEDELRQRLTIRNIRCPISLVSRIAKYSKKNYHVSLQQILKLFYDWDNRSLEFKYKLDEFLKKEHLGKDEKKALYRLLAFID